MSWSYASTTVERLTRDSSAQLRMEGRRVPGRSAWFSMRCASRAASWAGKR